MCETAGGLSGRFREGGDTAGSSQLQEDIFGQLFACYAERGSKKKEDSEYKWVQTEFISCKNPREVMVYVKDITEEWVAEEEHKRELQCAYEEVNKANQVKTEFMQHISHDFRTPMNAIMGWNPAGGFSSMCQKIKK